MGELDQAAGRLPTALGWAHGRDKTGAFFLKILPRRVSRRNLMTCLRQERGKGRSVTPVMRTGVCILLCFLGCSIWILRGKRGPQHYPVLPVPCPLPHQSRCKGHRWGLLATDKPLGWGGGHQGAEGWRLLQPPCACNCSYEWFGLLREGPDGSPLSPRLTSHVSRNTQFI